MSAEPVRFVTGDNLVVEHAPWGPHEWLCRSDIVDAELLQLVRVRMPPGAGHAFHRHPALEEVVYVLEGQAEVWVDRELRLLAVGETAHVPVDMVHGVYNGGPTTLVFLALLSPAKFAGPAVIDMSHEEPWKSLRPA